MNGLSSVEKIYVDPSVRMLYASFYLQGLIDAFGVRKFKFDTGYFNELYQNGSASRYDQFMAFILKGEKDSRIIIDFKDDISIDEVAYGWCDKYAKINLRSLKLDAGKKEKIIPIAPSFSIKVFANSLLGVCYGLCNYIKTKKYSTSSLTNFLSGYISRKRLPLSFYSSNNEIDKNYVFFVSSLWEHEYCVQHTNPWRYLFMKICNEQNEHIMFEGGFFSRAGHSESLKYKNYLLGKTVSMKTYLTNVKKSVFVFNTPAVHACHGWKLGEYLALGKAIISTPLENDLPFPLQHGENIHFVNTEAQLREAISYLQCDDEYRKKLELGAYKYYISYVKPVSVIKNIASLL